MTPSQEVYQRIRTTSNRNPVQTRKDLTDLLLALQSDRELRQKMVPGQKKIDLHYGGLNADSLEFSARGLVGSDYERGISWPVKAKDVPKWTEQLFGLNYSAKQILKMFRNYI